MQERSRAAGRDVANLVAVYVDVKAVSSDPSIGHFKPDEPPSQTFFFSEPRSCRSR